MADDEPTTAQVRVREVATRDDRTLAADTPCVAPPADLPAGETRLAVRPATGGGLHLRYVHVGGGVAHARVRSTPLGAAAPGARVFVEPPAPAAARWRVWALVAVVGRAS